MQERLNRLYEQYGYRKFKMSRFEDYDLYAQNRDFLRQDRIITFTDADGALKALKPDITLSIMKSNGGDSEKVYYNENVCREVGGAFREILQVGVESVGQIDPYAEAEVIALAARSLEQLSPKYVLALSDVSFVGSLLDQMGLSAPVRGKVLGLVARKNVPGLCVLAERGELTGEQADGLRELVELYAPLKEGIGRVGRLAKSNAAWGTAEDIKPYVDPAFENNIILTQTERLTMNSRPKDPKTARNKNVLIVGGSGSGKTRFWLKPNLLQCTSKTYPTSFVVTDPKGDIVVSCGHALQKNGYQIKILNSLNFKKSMHYNPFAYIHSEKDILKLVTTLIANTKGARPDRA